MALILLNSLPKSYDNLVTTLTWGKETLELEEITGALLSINQMKKANNKVKGLWLGIIMSVGETSLGVSLSRNKSRSKKRRIKDIQCYKCGKKGHIKRECLEWKKGNKENIEGSSKSTNVVEERDSESGDGDMLSVSSSRDHLTDSWIMDSACSYHMTSNKDWFDTYRLVNSGSILMGNDASCRVVRMGNIKVKMFDGVIRTLCDVRHVLDLGKNMILLGTLDGNSFNYKFSNGVMKVSKGVLTVMKG